MKKIIIEGATDSINNRLTIDVFRPNNFGNPYDYSKTFTGDFSVFKAELNDLKPDLTYHVDISGYTTGTLKIKIFGGFDEPNPIEETLTTTFDKGYLIHTSK